MKEFSPKKLKRMGENRRHMLERMTDSELLEIINSLNITYDDIMSTRERAIGVILAVESEDPEGHWSDLA